MKTSELRSMTLKVRNALLKSGAREDQVKAALLVLNPKREKAVRISTAVKNRIVAGLSIPGAKLVLTRDKRSGIRVYSMDGFMVATRNAAHATKHAHHREQQDVVVS
jgi:hypothetical protein